MRSVFFGTPAFTLPILDAVAEVTELVAVVTQPDRPAGRGRELQAPPAKQWAEARGIPVFQPQKLRDGVLASQLEALRPHVAVVAAYGRILPRELLDLPLHGCVNVHGSILPRWRGAAPIQRAVAAGDAITGVTLMRMDEGLDTGDMLYVLSVPIGPDDTGGSMHDKLAELGARAVREALPLYLAGELEPVPQEHDRATLAPLLEKEEGRLDFRRPATELACTVRGFDPWPGTYTFLEPATKGLLKITRAIAAEGEGAPGTVISTRPLRVACGQGALELLEVQPEGKRRMSAAELVLGRKVAQGQVLDPDRHA